MRMPIAINPQDGMQIHYVVEGRDGPVLIMQYGFMGYIDAWYEAGYVDALAGEIRLVLFDPRGMEKSDRPHDPDAYTNAKMASDVLALLDAVGAESGHFYGYSRGGRVGYELALNCGDRIRSVAIGAMHPYRRDPAQFTEQIEMFQMGWERSIPYHEERNGPLDPANREQLLRNDSLALAAASIAAQQDRGFDDALAEIKTPTLIFAGDRDVTFHGQSRSAAETMPGGRFVNLAGVDHGETFWRCDLVASLLRDWVFETHRNPVG